MSQSAAQAAPAKTRVLYIGGQLRSGSTLLGRLLGELAGFVNIGEVMFLFQPYLQNRLCGCGQPLRECLFWNEVIERAFGGYDKLDTEGILATKRSLERLRTAPKVLFAGNAPAIRERVGAYLNVIEPLYQAIREISGAKVIVDTSKSTLYAHYLSQAPSIELSVVHLVRDSRAVAYSFQRRKINPAVHWQEHRIGTVRPARVAMQWAAENALMRVLRPGRESFTVMRYEDVAGAPRAAVERICRLLDEPLPPLEFLSTPTVQFGVHHTATGNPDRFERQITITPDLEWTEKMAPRDRRIVTCLTFPLLLLYGYAGNEPLLYRQGLAPPLPPGEGAGGEGHSSPSLPGSKVIARDGRLQG